MSSIVSRMTHETHAPGHSRKARMTPISWLSVAVGAIVVALLIWHSLAGAHGESAGHGEAHVPQLWGLGILPFVVILGAIALLPLLPFSHHWWESNQNRFAVAITCAGVTVIYVLFESGASAVVTTLEHAIVAEYVPFIMLLFSLYVISGGINLRGDLAAHPSTNTAFLAVGAVIASVVGTTGASMLLIRPLLQTNRERRHVVHTVVFFIFLVSNIGGCLLPIGDPPLFLGFLKGVPFFWTLGLWKEWAFCCAALLVTYYIWDTIAYRKEEKRDIQRDETQKEPLRLSGAINFLWLGGVVAAVAFLVPGREIGGFTVFPFMRELLMLGFVAMSLFTTSRGVREANKFNYAAIIEVAALFVGIFITMQVPLAVLKVQGASLGLDRPWEYFWTTGGLSSFLDNAPTYLVFFQTANAMTHAPGAGIITLVTGEYIRADLLIAISLGAVFMGAMTYIGNGPNFMVKSIAEQSGVRMPSFFGYMFRYSVPILVPLLIIVTLLFLL